MEYSEHSITYIIKWCYPIIRTYPWISAHRDIYFACITTCKTKKQKNYNNSANAQDNYMVPIPKTLWTRAGQAKAEIRIMAWQHYPNSAMFLLWHTDEEKCINLINIIDKLVDRSTQSYFKLVIFAYKKVLCNYIFWTTFYHRF